MSVWRMSPRNYLGISIAAALLSGVPLPSQAACNLIPTAGDDSLTCDSGTSSGVVDTQGSNSLIFPGGGTGQVQGGVTFGAGNDLVQMDSGLITGSVIMGDGANIFRLNVGEIRGSVTQGSGPDIVQISGGTILGAVSQGAGIDSFSMSGGTIGSLQQGDGRDLFFMSGGTILGAFEDGDVARMTGGTIGRVDMKLDKNIFEMEGGRIIGNLVTGFDDDTITIKDGSIGGNISTSGGNDVITISGGDIGGEIRAGTGNDIFIWDTGGLIHSAVLMGDGDDRAMLHNLTEAILSSTPSVDGGLGNDTLTFDNIRSATPGRYVNWETVQLDNGSRLSLGGTFVLGDSGTRTGTMTVDGTSTLLVGTGVISPFTTGQLATLNNGGLIDMTTGSSSATDTLTINGNYVGNNGMLALQSVLGTDGSPSDKLVVSQGAIQGTTGIRVSNLGGGGGATLLDGIEVVQATNGATSSGSAFSLNGEVSAGAYKYYLYKGGATAGTADNWYLRSTIPVAPLPEPEGPVTELPAPAPGTPPTPEPGVEPIPIYRPEVPVYSALFPAAQQMVQAMLGTFHERMGDQSEQRATGTAGWGRVYGSSSRQSFAGTVSPRLDSSQTGFQVGTNLHTWTNEDGQTHHLGFFVGHSRLRGDVGGFNGGFQHLSAGNTTLRGDSAGLYWTFIGANGGYIDVISMFTRLNGNSESDRGIKLKTNGHNVLGSIEAGLPLPLSANWKIEPQVQLIADKTRLDSQNDVVSKVSFKADTNITARLGARLWGEYRVAGMPVQPYVRANVWHSPSGTNRVTFDNVTDIDTEQKSTTLDLNVGATLQVAKGVSLYGQVGYNKNLDSNALNGRTGTFGVRVEF